MMAIIDKILIFCLNYIYNYVDKSNDGKISKEELIEQIYNPIIDLIEKVNNKRNK